MKWLRALLAGQPLLEVALHEMPAENLWQELLAHRATAAEGALLVLWGLEEAGARTEVLMQQLNVQRDLFVRDLRVPWVLFIHPGLATRLQAQAPDFCDIAALWLRGDPPGLITPIVTTPAAGATGPIGQGAREASGPERSALLLQAERALVRREVHAAKDLLARFTLAGHATQEEKIEASLLQGVLCWRQGDVAGARMRLQDALGEVEHSGSAILRGKVAYYLAAVEESQANYPAARRLFRESLQAAEREDEPFARASVLHELARLEERQGNYLEARRLLQEALQSNETVDRYAYATSQSELAIVELRLGRHEEARKLLEDALPAFIQEGDRLRQAMAIQLLASVAKARGDLTEARRCLQEALAVRIELGDQPGRGAALHELAGIELQEGNLQEARRLLSESSKVFADTADLYGRAVSLLMLGQIEAASGRLQEGRAMLREAAATFEALQVPEAKEAARLLAEVSSPDGT